MKHWTAGNWTGARWFGPAGTGATCQLDVTDAPDTLYAVGTLDAAQELPIIWPARRRKPVIKIQAPLPSIVARATITDAADVVVSRGSVRAAARSAATDVADTTASSCTCWVRAISIKRDAPDVVMIGTKLGPVPITDDELLVFLMAA